MAVCVVSRVKYPETQLYVLFLRKPGPGGTPVWQGDSYTPTTVVTVLCNLRGVFFFFFSFLMTMRLLCFLLHGVLSKPCLATVKICTDNSNKPLNLKSSVASSRERVICMCMPTRELVKCPLACDSSLWKVRVWHFNPFLLATVSYFDFYLSAFSRADGVFLWRNRRKQRRRFRWENL